MTPSDRRDPADVLVVGGGLAGLTAAAHAARAGARVTLVDAGPTVGGRARTEQRDGACLNLGPHALYEAGEGMAVLAELGIDPPGNRPQATGPAVWRNQEGELPFGFRSLATTALLRPASRLAFARFHAGLGRLDARALDSTSMTQFLDDTIGTERGDLRAVIEGILRLSLYANAPEVYSAGAAIDQLRMAGSGVRYLDRGWGSLVHRLASVGHEAGVDLWSGVKITTIDRTSDHWTATDGDGNQWSGAAVVVAGLSPEATERLIGCAPGRLRTAAGPAVRAACLDLVLVTAPKVRFALDLDHHGYYSVHAPTADLADDGRALVSLALYRRPGEAGDADRDRATLRTFARRMGVEDTLAERYLHAMTVSHGMPLASRGGTSGRPGVEEFGPDGVVLAGDWVGPTGLLADASLSSGRAAGLLAVQRCRTAQVA